MKGILKATMFLLAMGMVTLAATCKESKGEETVMDERCTMLHDPGPCKGSFQRYYYDQEKGECMMFIYGGCQGAVPFETLEECQGACGG